ncbi:MAG TPA: four helix bundle protein [Chitinophagaceae bacterium]|nr:four helix bundle protein [Chitinophagaceae bacterium]
MNEGKENIIVQKSYAFALQIIQLYKLLIEKKEFVLSKQILRSGTSIGANIHEAVASQSKRDFVHKLAIAVKEARETSYWLNLLKDGQYITNDEFVILNNHCDEIIKILNSIILTTKERYFANS